jgi:hypothetical protein
LLLDKPKLLNVLFLLLIYSNNAHTARAQPMLAIWFLQSFLFQQVENGGLNP